MDKWGGRYKFYPPMMQVVKLWTAVSLKTGNLRHPANAKINSERRCYSKMVSSQRRGWLERDLRKEKAEFKKTKNNRAKRGREGEGTKDAGPP